MKLTIIGAASPRFPLLLHSLLKRSDIQIDELFLYDIDEEKLSLINETIIAELQEHTHPCFTIQVASSLIDAVKDADYIFSSIRVGGQEARIIDESSPLDLGQIGQETVGVGGFFLALRTIPVVLDQIEVIKKHAPHAWVINFTNPSGLVTQAVKSLSGFEKIIGICDAPELIATHVATIYGCSDQEVVLKYFGLNHLGWVYSVEVGGVEKLEDLIRNHIDEFIALEPFYAGMREHMLSTGLIPNEYLYYYLQAPSVLANQKKAVQGRAQSIHTLDTWLYASLRKHTGSATELYNTYIDKRNGTYMQMESGYERNIPKTFSLLDMVNSKGYDAIALNVLSSLQNGEGDTLILNIANDTRCPSLETGDIIEVSASLEQGHFASIAECPTLCEEAWDLILQMKQYERQVVKAIREKREAEAVKALALHPLVGEKRAPLLFSAMRDAHEKGGSPAILV
ncbi:MAG TPA: glycoside hydrolase [Sphaerochaeta sp.]|nr:glycoside hydrolase [Sphaerochaeta sp.]